jgi:hypothetical protein
VTTSSPESEAHVEHTILANGIRQGHTGGLVLSQLHIGLAVGFAIVACLTAFGGGMIVGMWYKASEQATSISTSVAPAPAEQSAQSQETTSQPPEPPAPVTFYNTLTNSNATYAPLTTPATSGPSGSAKEVVAPAAGTTSSAKAASAGSKPTHGAATGAATDSVKAATAPTTTPSAVGTTRTAVVRESQKHTKTAHAAKAAPAETTASPGGAKTAAQKPVAPARQAGKETGTQRPAGATATAKAPGAEDVSARGQPAAVPGQELRHRGRAGSYTERTGAGQTAQPLTAQEQVPAIVAGKD